MNKGLNNVIISDLEKAQDELFHNIMIIASIAESNNKNRKRAINYLKKAFAAISEEINERKDN